MAPMLFAKAILPGEPIKVLNHGRMQRDFTYIDEIVEGVLRCCDKPAAANPSFDPLAPDPATAATPHRLFNIGNSQPTKLLDFISVIDQALGCNSIQDLQPIQPGDVVGTVADNADLEEWLGFRPAIPIEDGVERFARWNVKFKADTTKC